MRNNVLTYSKETGYHHHLLEKYIGTFWKEVDLFMARLACMTLPYSHLPFDRALEGISRSGYKYIAFGLQHAGLDIPDENDDEAIFVLEKLFDAYELKPVMMIGNKQFASGQPIERARKRLQIAKALGVEEVISVGIGNYRKFPEEIIRVEEFEEKHRAFVAHFQQIAKEAEQLNMIITLKPHTGNTASSRELLKTLEEIGSPYVKVSYDPGNVQFYEGISADGDFIHIADRTHSIIAKDHRGPRAHRDFPIPGSGGVNFPVLFKTWRNYGGNGNVVVERVDGPSEPSLIDQRIYESRVNLERMMLEAGLKLE